MTDKTTADLIDEAARKIANDILNDPEMKATERVRSFQVLVDYRKVVNVPVEPEKPPPERFDQMRDRIRAVTGGGHTDEPAA